MPAFSKPGGTEYMSYNPDHGPQLNRFVAQILCTVYIHNAMHEKACVEACNLQTYVLREKWLHQHGIPLMLACIQVARVSLEDSCQVMIACFYTPAHIRTCPKLHGAEHPRRGRLFCGDRPSLCVMR